MNIWKLCRIVKRSIEVDETINSRAVLCKVVFPPGHIITTGQCANTRQLLWVEQCILYIEIHNLQEDGPNNIRLQDSIRFQNVTKISPFGYRRIKGCDGLCCVSTWAVSNFLFFGILEMHSVFGVQLWNLAVLLWLIETVTKFYLPP